MWLEKIRFEGVRNLEDKELIFDPKVNFIVGNNGAGKTSILEAIHFLAVGRSFRTNRDNEIVKFNAPYLKISGLVHNNHENYEAEIRLIGPTKQLFLQRRQQAKLSDYLGWLPVVTILLADIDLVSGPPERRRNFIDLAIAKINRSYLKKLIAYRKVLMQRNKLLQEKAEQAHYEVWESALSKYGYEIYEERRKIIPPLLTDAQRFYSMFTNQKIIFEYRANLDNYENETTNPQEKLSVLLKNYRAREQELGRTIIGPHRDDIVIEKWQTLNDKEQTSNVRKFGSEGEQRLAALSLKLAEAELFAKNNQQPIFLLDEVAAELDTTNTKKFFELIQGQFFYATAKYDKDIINQKGRIIYVEEGKITKIETTG